MQTWRVFAEPVITYAKYYESDFHRKLRDSVMNTLQTKHYCLLINNHMWTTCVQLQ